MDDKCPECGRVAGTCTYTCTVPECHESRFCCPICMINHLYKHIKERDKKIKELERSCKRCDGTGKALHVHQGYAAGYKDCPACKGRGY